MTSKLFFTGVLCLALISTGCFKHTYHVGLGAPDGEIVYNHWHHHWLFGLIGGEAVDQVIDLDKLCPSGNATIHEEVTFLNGLVDVLIGIIYSPTTVTIRCDSSPEHVQIELSPQQLQQIVYSQAFRQRVELLLPSRLEDVILAQGGAISNGKFQLAKNTVH